MSLTNLENLVATGKLQREPRANEEIEGLVRSEERRLRDAGNADNAEDSRFDLAYNAAHAFALAALRWQTPKRRRRAADSVDESTPQRMRARRLHLRGIRR